MNKKKIIFLIFLIMPKIGFPMPTAKNRFQILKPHGTHPKKHVFKKNMVLKEKITINYYNCRTDIDEARVILALRHNVKSKYNSRFNLDVF